MTDDQKLELINEIEKYPELYKDGQIACSHRLWNTVATNCNKSVNYCRYAWKILTFLYKKYYEAPISTDEKIKKFRYYNNLEFLRPYLNGEKIVPNIPPPRRRKRRNIDKEERLWDLKLIKIVKESLILHQKNCIPPDETKIPWEEISCAMNAPAETCKETWIDLKKSFMELNSRVQIRRRQCWIEMNSLFPIKKLKSNSKKYHRTENEKSEETEEAKEDEEAEKAEETDHCSIAPDRYTDENEHRKPFWGDEIETSSRQSFLLSLTHDMMQMNSRQLRMFKQKFAILVNNSFREFSKNQGLRLRKI